MARTEEHIAELLSCKLTSARASHNPRIQAEFGAADALLYSHCSPVLIHSSE
jgi:hypothetical protein